MMFFVYIDWTTEDVPRPFYVGKGSRRRVADKTPRNPLHGNIIKAHGVNRLVVFSTANEAEAFLRERQLIVEYKTRAHVEGHWGANFTEGGEGTSGWKAPKSWCEAVQVRQKNRLSSLEARLKRSVEAKEDWAKRKANGYVRPKETKKRKPRSIEGELARKAKQEGSLKRWSKVRAGLLPRPNITPVVRAKLGKGKDHFRRSVLQLSREGLLISKYPAITMAALSTQIGAGHITECCKGQQIGAGHITECCKGQRKTAGGFIWSYA